MINLKRFTRRKFIKLTAAGTAGLVIASRCGDDNDLPVDVILKGGNAFINGNFVQCDIALAGGMIKEIDLEMDLDDDDDDIQIINCNGLYVCPGWTDLHIHVGEVGLDPERMGPKTGVVAAVDAGTYGAQTFSNFMNHREAANYEIYSWINLRKDGITFSNVYTEQASGVEDIDGAVELISQYPDIIKGFKVRTDSTNTTDDDPMFMTKITSELARELNLPVMYHLGSSPPHILDFLEYTKPGDFITHFLRTSDNCFLDTDSEIFSAVLEAKNNGVLFDVGHGTASFVFENAIEALNKGFTDFTISSDLWQIPANNTAFTFANIMSKFLLMGMSLEDVVYKSTTQPRELLGLDSTIAVGKRTDLTIFSLVDGDFTFTDAISQKKTATQRIIPNYAIVNSNVIEAGSIDRELFL